LAWEDYHNFCLACWALFAFWEEDFYKIKDRETLSRSHNDFNTTDDNTRLRASLCCAMHVQVFKIFGFEISFDLCIYLWYWGLNSGFYDSEAGALRLRIPKPCLQPTLFFYFIILLLYWGTL
jgi:hypothetical protein